MASQKHKDQLHFVLVPLMAPGHFIPMLDMAKLLAQRGVSVSIITTPLIAARFSPTVDRAVQSGLPLRLFHLRFPSVEAGLPEGCESAETIPFRLITNFFVAIDKLQESFEQFFQGLEPRPSCIIADKNIGWISETAQKFKTLRIMFDGTSCFTLLCSHILHVTKVHESVSQSEPFLLPGLPDRIELTKAQLPAVFNPGTLDMHNFRERIREAETGAHGVVINSFEELEPNYLTELKKVKGDKIWCIGPLSMCNQNSLDMAQRGNKSSIDQNHCLEWLDAQEPSSVVYVCLGSLTRLMPSQLIEVGLGLEESKRPFIWVIRGGDKAEEIEKWIEQDGFEERTKERGLIIRGWAPQVLILSHWALGVFLTHCGWNSTLEGVCAGMPMITWPMFAEQFFNEKLVVEVLKIGVSLGVQSVVYWWEEEKLGVVVKREAISKAVERVMDGGVEGRNRRERARELGEMAKRAMEEGGSSYLNMTLLIQDVMLEINHKQGVNG